MTTNQRIIRRLFLSLLFFISGFAGVSQTVNAEKIAPRPNQYYYDEVGVLNTSSKETIEGANEYYQNTKKKPQVVVATIKNTDDINQYASDLFSDWGIGNKSEDNGVLIIFAKNHGNNNVRIEVGYGLEGTLTDSMTGQILRDNEKNLKSHDKSKVNKGLIKVFNTVTTVVDKEYGYKATKKKVPLDRYQTNNQGNGKIEIIVIIIIIVLALIFGNHGGGGSSGGRRNRRYYDDGYFGGYGGYYGSGGSSGGGFGGFGGGSSGGGGSSI